MDDVELVDVRRLLEERHRRGRVTGSTGEGRCPSRFMSREEQPGKDVLAVAPPVGERLHHVVVDRRSEAVCSGSLRLPEARCRSRPGAPIARLGVLGPRCESPVEERHLEIDLKLVTKPCHGPCAEQGCGHCPGRARAVAPAGAEH